jgi:hypothetical protein
MQFLQREIAEDGCAAQCGEAEGLEAVCGCASIGYGSTTMHVNVSTSLYKCKSVTEGWLVVGPSVGTQKDGLSHCHIFIHWS